MAGSAFVGREKQLELLLEGLTGLAAGRGTLFMLVGEPGIGKTRLADEFCERATARGATVAWGAAWDGGGAPAFWPWIQVVRALQPGLPEPDERLRRELGPLWEESAPASTMEESSRDPDLLRFRRFDALRALLQTAAARAPLVVVLDDLHAADRMSLLALQFVASALRGVPVMLIGTHRDTEALLDQELGVLLARIARCGKTLYLGRLGRDEVSRLMAELDPVTPRLVDDVYQLSAGNPLFVGETLRLVRTGRMPEDIGGTVGGIIRDRLTRFSPATRAALEAAAVIGRELSPNLLADICETSPGELRERLRAPRAAGVIEELDKDRIRFAHALFRECLYEDLEPARRARLHLRTGEALAKSLVASREPVEESIASHLLAALPEGDAARAFEWAVRAGETLLRSVAFDRAVAMFEGALTALDQLPADPVRRIDIELSLAGALAQAGNAARSRAISLAAAEHARASRDGVRLARAALTYGAEIRIAIVDTTLVSLLEEALSMLGDAEAGLRARLMARLAAAEQPAPDPALPMQRAREAIALARRVGDADTLLATLHMAGSALVDYANPEERLPLALELVSLALPRGELIIAQRGYIRAFIDCLELGDFAGADDAAAACERLGEALGHPRWRWRVALMRSMRALIEGRWADSERYRAEAADLAGQSDDPNAEPALGLHWLGALRARESGNPGHLASPWDLAIDSVEATGPWRTVLRASILARFGETEAARRLFGALQLDLETFALDPMLLSITADVVTAIGDRAWAERLLSPVEALGTRMITWGHFGLIWDGPPTQWAGGLLAVLGRRDEAVVALEDALASAESLGARPLAARLEHQLACVLLERKGSGDGERARALLDTALAFAVELGMTHLSTRIEQTKAKAGVQRDSVMRAVAAPTLPAFQLCREGEIWAVSSGNRTARLKHSRGLEMLALLVQSPGKEFHVLEIGGIEPGEAVDTGDAGELLDDSAKLAYRRRIADLREELQEAESWADSDRRDRLRAELEFLEEELARGVGLGGRSRRAAASVERARVNVQKRLRAVVRKIGEVLPELGRHLESEVKTGTYVRYGRVT